MNRALRIAFGAILALFTATSHANNECKLLDSKSTAAAVFEKMDRFSPYALGSDESTNSIQKLKNHSLDSLAIIFRSQLIDELNLELQICGLPKITQRHLQFLTQAGDYQDIILAIVRHQKEVTLTHRSTGAQSHKTGISVQTVTLLLD